MKIEFERHGGTANIRLTTTVDTAKLPGDEAAQFEQLISQVEPDPPKMEMAAGCGARACCRFSYTIKVTDGKKTRTFRFGEGGNRDLVGLLTDKAKEAVA